jgi:hypothetical protein
VQGWASVRQRVFWRGTSSNPICVDVISFAALSARVRVLFDGAGQVAGVLHSARVQTREGQVREGQTSPGPVIDRRPSTICSSCVARLASLARPDEGQRLAARSRPPDPIQMPTRLE